MCNCSPELFEVSVGRVDWRFESLWNQSVSVEVPSGSRQNFSSGSCQPAETEAADLHIRREQRSIKLDCYDLFRVHFGGLQVFLC